MNSFSYKIVSKRRPCIKVANKTLEKFQTHTNSTHQMLPVSRCVEAECLTCEYISDGSTVIKLSELVRKLESQKEIKLYPLSLSFDKNLTEHYAAKDNEGFSSVTINVDINKEGGNICPSKLVCYNDFASFSYAFHQLSSFEFDHDSVTVMIYSSSNNITVLEINLDVRNDYIKNLNGWYASVPKYVFGSVTKLLVFVSDEQNDFLLYELQSDNLQQNQKITILNYL